MITAVWRVVVAASGVCAYYLLPRGSFNTFTLLHQGWRLNLFTLLIDAGVRNDANWYAGIAQHGYSYSTVHESSVGFYPLYPILVRLLSLSIGDVYVAGMLISTACLVVAVALLVAWMQRHGAGGRAAMAVALLLCFPFSFFFAAMYSESLYLMLVLATFLCCERKSWLLAALCAFLAVLARPTGVILLPCLLVLTLTSSSRGWKPWLPLAAGIGGIAVFTGYQYLAFGTPLAYVHAHALPPEYATLSQAGQDLLLHARLGIPSWYLGCNLAIGLLFLLPVPLVYRKLGPAYATFATLTVLMRMASTLPGMERMVIVDFPVFAVLACTNKRRFLTAYFVFNIYLLIFFTAAFEAHWSVF